MSTAALMGNEIAPIQLAQCRFLGLAIFNAKIIIYFSNKIYGSNFIKQHSETVMVWSYQNADYSLRKIFIVLFIIIVDTLSFPILFLYGAADLYDHVRLVICQNCENENGIRNEIHTGKLTCENLQPPIVENRKLRIWFGDANEVWFIWLKLHWFVEDLYVYLYTNRRSEAQRKLMPYVAGYGPGLWAGSSA